MIKTVKVEDAVGLKLAHDITEIRPGQFKGPAFRQGHTVCGEDVCRLQRLGKNHLYVIELEEDEIHENENRFFLAKRGRSSSCYLTSVFVLIIKIVNKLTA